MGSLRSREVPDDRESPGVDRARIHAFLVAVGASDLHAWLGITRDTPHREALVHLERRRRQLEASLTDPVHAREAELFLDAYDLLRDALRPSSPHDAARRTVIPDYYAILGLSPRATYAEVERAWRRHQSVAGGDDGLLAQAWRVLGDPLNRANYDRSRAVPARVASTEEPLFEADPPTQDGPPPVVEVVLPGPDLREVAFDPGVAEAIVTVPVLVRGAGRFAAAVHLDHGCMSSDPAGTLDLAPGRHALVVRFDRARAVGMPFSCTLVLSNDDTRQVAQFRVSERRRGRHTELLPFALAALLLVGFGWWLGSRTSVRAAAPLSPTTLGEITQLPSASTCLATAAAPLPSHVDVHTDGLGRPTGLSFGGVASPEVEACVRQALLRLDFPPTRDGLPAFHRYRIPAVQDVPP